MRTEPTVPARWAMTAGLLILGALAAAAAPRLRPPPPEPQVAEAVDVEAADLCVSLGQVECCYREPKE